MQDKLLSVRTRRLALGLCAMGLLSTRTKHDLFAQATTHEQPTSMTSGCAVNNSKTGLLTQATTDGNETPRTYLLQIPDNYNQKRTYPLIFVFHGARGTATQSHSWGMQNARGASGNAIFVFPQGIMFRNEQVGWNDFSQGYDMAFFDKMLHEIEAAYCIDPAQIFAAGFSWGGDFVTALACSRGDAIRAIAVNSTNDEFKDRTDYKTFRWLPCASHNLPAIRFEHAVDGDSAYPAPFFATTSKLFQYFGQCSTKSQPVPSAGSTSSCVSYSGCSKQLTECSFDKTLGHRLPPDWAQDTWNFFQGFQHP